MDTKRCSTCKEDKPLSEFNKKTASEDGLQELCRSCNSDRSKKYYQDNKEKHRKTVSANKKKYVRIVREKLAFYLSEHPCVDCGFIDIRALEFDHVKGTKKTGVGQLASSGCNWETVLAEIEKCEVRCKNCHAIKTYERLDSCWLTNLSPTSIKVM